MITIPDEQLFSHSQRIQDRVVLITGGANGIGKETAKWFSKFGAKVVIGDRDIVQARAVVDRIRRAGGEAIACLCDVTSWDDQVALFDAAVSHFGRVDVVIANAGVAETGDFKKPQIEDGRCLKPCLGSMDVNITGVMYTAHLGIHYIGQTPALNGAQAIVFLGSMASWQPVGEYPIYAASKHAVLGLARSITPSCKMAGVRVAVIHPGFVATSILPDRWKHLTEVGLFVPIERVAGAIFYAATDPDMNTSGCPFVLNDSMPGVLRLDQEQLKEGVYRLIDDHFKQRLRERGARQSPKNLQARL